MYNEPCEKLHQLIVEYGRSLYEDSRHGESLLKDYCGQYKREIFALVIAQKNRVAEDLLSPQSSIKDGRCPNLQRGVRVVTRRLVHDFPLTGTAT